MLMLHRLRGSSHHYLLYTSNLTDTSSILDTYLVDFHL